jgi:aconitate hydratase
VTGHVSDPRELEVEFTRALEPARYPEEAGGLLPPGNGDEDGVAPPRYHFPRPESLEAGLRGPVLLRLGDEVSTDQVLPWGARVTPLIGDLEALAEHAFAGIDPQFAARARQHHGGFVVAGTNFGLGPPRLFAALALLELGVRATLALSYAPGFHAQLVEAGILPLLFTGEADAERVAPGDELEVPGLGEALDVGRAVTARNLTQGVQYTLRHQLDPLACAIARAGGRLAYAERAGLVAAPATPVAPPPAPAGG